MAISSAVVMGLCARAAVAVSSPKASGPAVRRLPAGVQVVRTVATSLAIRVGQAAAGDEPGQNRQQRRFADQQCYSGGHGITVAYHGPSRVVVVGGHGRT